jgi:uncharacterized delta-60 repeat protein
MTRTFTFLLFIALSQLVQAQPGNLDPAFANSGIRVLQPGPTVDNGWEVIPLEDTSLLVCGTTNRNNKPSSFITRLNEDGTTAMGFGITDGYTYFNAYNETYAYGMVLADDGSVYLAGLAYVTVSQSAALLVHVLPNGQPDPAFGTGGQVTYVLGTVETQIQDLAIQPDGKLVLAGRTGFGSTSNSLLLRFHPDGTLDSTFSGDGVLPITLYSTADQLYDVAVLDDGSIVAAGVVTIGSTERTLVVKCDASGALDTSFGTAGTGAVVPALGFTVHLARGVEADGQRFYITGEDRSNNNNYNAYVARMNDDGSIDTSFGTAGVFLLDQGTYDTGTDLAVQNDGKVLFCGASGGLGFAGNKDHLVMRLTESGSADATFGTNGVTLTAVGGNLEEARSVAIQPDGKVVSAGVVMATNNDVSVLRYLNDITTDIAAPSANMQLIMFPVPADRSVRIGSGATGQAEITVLDLQGRMVISLVANGSMAHVGTEAMPNGTYVVRMIQGGTASSALLIVQH